MALPINALSRRERTWRYNHLAGLADYQPILLARFIGCSVRQLERLIYRDIGKTPKEFLRELKLIRAAQMLLSGSTIKEAAFEFGYSDVSNFSRDIRNVLKATPKDLYFFSYRRCVINNKCAD